jgi:LPXTG-site transpeptidase (sortase) family protein
VLREKLRITAPDNRLIIPKLAKNVPLVEATDVALRRGDFKTFEEDVQDALRFGVVRYPGTAEPGGPGNVFITGHSAYLFWDSGRYKEVFARLSELDVGDTYAISYRGKLHHYRVAKKFEVSPKDISVLAQPSDKRMSTLMTCTPVGTTLRRLIVQAEEIQPGTGKFVEIAEGSEKTHGTKWDGELAI